jgi:hypothetical protein
MEYHKNGDFYGGQYDKDHYHDDLERHKGYGGFRIQWHKIRTDDCVGRDQNGDLYDHQHDQDHYHDRVECHKDGHFHGYVRDFHGHQYGVEYD